MSLHGNDVCLLEAEDYNLYEEEASDHAFSRSEKHHIGGGGKTMEAEKRIRREIANSNERRRMQSINAGFQALRTLLPRHEGEKLSKAAILQQTAEYIYSLEQEKTRLLSQNCQLKRLLNQHEGGEIPLKKRKSEVLVPIIPDSTEESSESVLAVTTLTALPVKKDDEVRAQLECERGLRRLLEERLTALEAQMYRDGSSAPAPPVTLPPTPIAAPYEIKDDAECKIETDELELQPLGVGVGVGVVTAESLLEAVMKAEPRVEVELVEAPPLAPAPASTSRQNLETIVEAIRHLEGDHLFQEDSGDAPLALTKKPPSALPPPPSRPGVIVVKHS